MDLAEIEAIRAHHEGQSHIAQPCWVRFPDGRRSVCDVQTLLDAIKELAEALEAANDAAYDAAYDAANR